MATITGTITSDVLLGTSGDDLFLPYGVGPNEAPDLMSGGDGRDIYDLRPAIGSTGLHRYVIDDNGMDGAVDRIESVGALVQSASLGYQGFTTALRDGDDLIIVTPGKPYRFHSPGKPSYEITILDHYAGEAVEWLVAGGVTYRLPSGGIGTFNADLMAGTHLDDTLKGRGGNDYMTGNDGHDTMLGGGGDDYLLGGNGNDTLSGHAGNDRIYGGAGNDTVAGGNGFDYLYLADGNDVGRGGGSNDTIYGQDGNDRLFGGAGEDMLSGGRGDDTMRGGTGGDTYRYGYDLDNFGTMRDAGHDVIKDVGDKATWNNFDRIELFGYYGPGDGSAADAYARLSFDKVGDDMVITTDGGTGSVTVTNQFGRNKFAIEELHFSAGYWEPKQFKILDGAKTDIGDDRRTNSDFNEVLFGSDSDDQVFGGSGTNFIWLGDGADTLLYRDSDPAFHFYGTGGGAVNDIVQDFDITTDQMDFREVGTATSISNLLIVDNAVGNASINWYSGDIEIANIFIELRGVAAADLTADHFVFG